MKTATAAGFLGLILAGVTVASDSAGRSPINAAQGVQDFVESALPRLLAPRNLVLSAKKQDLRFESGPVRTTALVGKWPESLLPADLAGKEAAPYLLSAPVEQAAIPHVDSNEASPKRNSLPRTISRPDDIARARSDIIVPIGASTAGHGKLDRAVTLDIGSPSESAALFSGLNNADLKAGVPIQYLTFIERCAHETGVEERWLLAILHAENAAFDATAVSPAGTIGLMQVKPLVGRHYGAEEVMDPEQNICAAARFLKDLFIKYDNPVVAVAAYNAGENRIDERAGLSVIPETVDYVSRVTGYYYSGKASTAHPKQLRLHAADLPADWSGPNSLQQAQPLSPFPALSKTGKPNLRRLSRPDRIKQTSVVLNVVSEAYASFK